MDDPRPDQTPPGAREVPAPSREPYSSWVAKAAADADPKPSSSAFAVPGTEQSVAPAAVSAEPAAPVAATEPAPAQPPVEPGPSAAAEPPATQRGEATSQTSSPAVAPAATALTAEPSAATGETAHVALPDAPPAMSPEDAAAKRAAQVAAAAKAEERRARAQVAWERVVSAHASAETITGYVTAAVKGGLLVDAGGVRGFLPASQVRVVVGTPIESVVKTQIPLKVIDVDTARRRVVVSHRRAVESDRRAKRSELLRSLEVGQVRDAVVARLTDFGAFVDLGGVDGLIPMRELAFERIDKASDVLTVGETVAVVVLRIDEGGKKISLSRRNALPDPWRDHADVIRRDAVVTGKVVGKEPRLQVELAPGVIGTVRESDADPADYELGEPIEVAVRSVDRATRRIALTTMHGTAAVQPAPTSSGFAPLGVELGRRT